MALSVSEICKTCVRDFSKWGHIKLDKSLFKICFHYILVMKILICPNLVTILSFWVPSWHSCYGKVFSSLCWLMLRFTSSFIPLQVKYTSYVSYFYKLCYQLFFFHFWAKLWWCIDIEYLVFCFVLFWLITRSLELIYHMRGCVL